MKITCLALVGLLATGVPALAGADPVADASGHIQQGNYAAAIERLRPGTPFVREQIQERFLYAVALAGAGERAEAAQLFEALIADYPGMPEPYNNLAALYAAEGKLEQAGKILERAMRTDPRYAAIYGNLDAVYAEMARASYAKALRLDEPQPAPPHLKVLHAVTGPAAGTGATPRMAELPAPFENDTGSWPENQVPEQAGAVPAGAAQGATNVPDAAEDGGGSLPAGASTAETNVAGAGG